MDHSAEQAQVFALYDGELAGEDRRKAEAHLERCAECRKLCDEWAGAARKLFTAKEPEASEAFAYRVLDQIALRERPRRAASWLLGARWLVPALGAAFALLLFVNPARRPVSIEALLLDEEREGNLNALVLARETPSAEDMLGIVMEGQR